MHWGEKEIAQWHEGEAKKRQQREDLERQIREKQAANTSSLPSHRSSRTAHHHNQNADSMAAPVGGSSPNVNHAREMATRQFAESMERGSNMIHTGIGKGGGGAPLSAGNAYGSRSPPRGAPPPHDPYSQPHYSPTRGGGAPQGAAGYGAPPPQGGGYGGYGEPPAQGGYGAPPPPPGGGYGAPPPAPGGGYGGYGHDSQGYAATEAGSSAYPPTSPLGLYRSNMPSRTPDAGSGMSRDEYDVMLEQMTKVIPLFRVSFRSCKTLNPKP
jgi:hypothetical protein